ncbi:MAG: hypothetical protein Alpg2KO_06690 [Alphaproteobacteria bacterium]
MSDAPRQLVVLSWPRCGTTALGDSLDRTEIVQDLREVFHPRQVKRKQNFFGWRAQLFGQTPEASLPHPEQPLRLWSGFIEHLGSLSDGRPWQLVDIKVSALHHLDGAFSRPGRKPELLVLLKKLNTPILRITNDQPIRQHFSRLRMFHRQREDMGPLHVDCQDMQNRLEHMHQIEQWLSAWLDDHPMYRTIPASQLIENNRPSPACMSCLQDLTGQNIPAIETDLRPGEEDAFPPLANRRELQTSFAWTNWAQELETCLDQFRDADAVST